MFSAVIPLLLIAELPLLSAQVLDMEPGVERQRLRSDLLRDYERSLQGTKVAVFYDLRHVLGLDERDQILSVSGRLQLSWTDPALKWKPGAYSGLRDVRLSAQDVWLPELQALYNVRPFRLFDPVRSPPVSASSNGTVTWSPPVRFDVPCTAYYRHFPFDSHTCAIVLLDDALDNTGLHLPTHRRPSGPVQGTEWVVNEVVHSEEAMQRIKVSMRLERTSRVYRYVCVIPTLVAMVTLLCGFWLLADEAARHVIGCANVVVLSMLLQHLAATVPAGRHTPIIAQYSASCLCLSAIFVVITVVSGLLRTARGVVPDALLRIARLSLDRPLCLFVFSHGRFSEATSTGDDSKRRDDWFLVSVLVDRIAFWCFALIFAILLVVLAAV